MLLMGILDAGVLTIQEEGKLFAGFWLPEHQAILEELKNKILTEPVLQQPDPSQQFCDKSDWSNQGMGAMLLQADPSHLSAIKAKDLKNEGGLCFFELTRKGTQL